MDNKELVDKMPDILLGCVSGHGGQPL